MTKLIRPTRRAVLAGSTAFAASLAMPSLSRAASRPMFTHGVQSGDVDTQSGMIWTRTDRPARVKVEISTTESFANARQLAPMNALPNHDLAVKRLVEGLPSDQDIFYRFTAPRTSTILFTIIGWIGITSTTIIYFCITIGYTGTVSTITVVTTTDTTFINLCC